MYEYISGPVAEAPPAYAVIDAGGVGYYLHISLETFSAVEHAQNARLYVHYIVREDAQILYGFATKVEREFFRHLISVSGVGGNTARMILSTYSPRELQGIITSGNAVLLKNVKGLGLKTAQKIIVELSGKLTGLGHADAALPAAGNGEKLEEALAALVMLGFAKTAAEKALRGILRENPGEEYPLTPDDLAAVEKLRAERYATWEWNYGKSPACTMLRRRRVDGCGLIEAYITVEHGKIAALTFKGDFFSASEPDELAAHFVGCTPNRAGYEKALGDVDVSRYFAGLQKDELIDILCEG